VQPVGDAYGPPSMHQIREEYLTSRVGVGADHDPNDPKERDVHWGKDMNRVMRRDRIVPPSTCGWSTLV
jgi:hypothetical protein